MPSLRSASAVLAATLRPEESEESDSEVQLPKPDGSSLGLSPSVLSTANWVFSSCCDGKCTQSYSPAVTGKMKVEQKAAMLTPSAICSHQSAGAAGWGQNWLEAVVQRERGCFNDRAVAATTWQRCVQLKPLTHTKGHGTPHSPASRG